MVTKAKSLYQVKLILDYLPEDEYKLIPQETIDYIDENFEYDENFIIDPKIPLEKQKIDDKAYDLLEKIVKQTKTAYSNEISTKQNNSSAIDEYIKKVKQSNKNYDTMIENIRLNNLIEFLKKENSKIPKAKELLEEYKEALQLKDNEIEKKWNSICSWGPMAMLPIFQILGTKYKSKHINSIMFDEKRKFDLFTKIDFVYDSAVASIKVGKGVKSEGELIISGTKGYAYVPAPWWKTEYFEIRFENQTENQRYFYQLDGEGYRYELIDFVKNIESDRNNYNISQNVTNEICGIIEDFYNNKDVLYLNLENKK